MRTATTVYVDVTTLVTASCEGDVTPGIEFGEYTERVEIRFTGRGLGLPDQAEQQIVQINEVLSELVGLKNLIIAREERRAKEALAKRAKEAGHAGAEVS